MLCVRRTLRTLLTRHVVQLDHVQTGHVVNTCQKTRCLSLLRPSVSESYQQGVINFLIKNMRPPSVEENKLIVRRNKAGQIMSESLVNSIISSMLKSDYCAALGVPDSLESYVIVSLLHVYPVHVRFSDFPDREISRVRKQLLTALFLDLKQRLRENRMNPFLIKRVLGQYMKSGEGLMLYLDAGILSNNGQELGERLHQSVLQGQYNDTTMSNALTAAHFLLQTIDKLNSYSNDELIRLCVEESGFVYPTLGGQVMSKPDQLYNYEDYDKDGLPGHLEGKAAHVSREL